MTRRRRMDAWSVITLGCFIFYILFMVYPLFRLFVSSIVEEGTGAFTLKSFEKFFSTGYYRNTVVNSLKVTVCVTLLSILIAVPLAYLLTVFRIRGAAVIRVLLLISSMSAPFIGAYSWVLLLGRNGMITNFARNHLGIALPAIYGFPGIVLVLTLQLVPLIFMYVSGALKNMDSSLLEAAESMNCTGIRKILRVVLPLILPTLLAGALLVFMRALADFGTPMLIGEGYKTVPVLIYSSFLGESSQDGSFAAAVSVLVVIMATAAFLLQKLVARKLSYSMNMMNPIQSRPLRGGSSALAHLFVYGYLAVALLPQLCVVETSFRNTAGLIFAPGHSLGSYRSAFSKMSSAIQNTATLSAGAIVLVVLIAILAAYVTVRRPGPLTNALDTMTMMPYIVPGSILGICFITAFNSGPLVLTGTGLIMIFVFAVRRLPYTLRSSSAMLYQIDNSVEEASLSLGAGNLKTFFRIILPIMLPGVLSGAILSWTTMISELSASVMLYTGRTRTMTVAIYTEVVRGNYGVAAALSTLLSFFTICAIVIVFKLTGKDEITL